MVVLVLVLVKEEEEKAPITQGQLPVSLLFCHHIANFLLTDSWACFEYWAE